MGHSAAPRGTHLAELLQRRLQLRRGLADADDAHDVDVQRGPATDGFIMVRETFAKVRAEGSRGECMVRQKKKQQVQALGSH